MVYFELVVRMKVRRSGLLLSYVFGASCCLEPSQPKSSKSSVKVATRTWPPMASYRRHSQHRSVGFWVRDLQIILQPLNLEPALHTFVYLAGQEIVAREPWEVSNMFFPLNSSGLAAAGVAEVSRIRDWWVL